MPPARLRMRGAPALLVGMLLCACVAPPPPGVVVSDGRHVMGTVLELTLVAADVERGRAALDELFGVAEELDALLSRHDPASALSRLNARAGAPPQRVAPELARVLGASVAYSRLTHGSFDVTVGPLVALWQEAARRDRPPGAEELAAARARVGWRHLEFAGHDRVGIAGAGASVDLGGIAKGWALDRMLPVLERYGIEQALLNFGQSSVRALGRPADGAAWRLLVRGPGDRLLGVMNLVDAALSISGSLGQWVEIGGERYGHVIDPRSGRALRRRRQAIVLARDATEAEVLSKALLVLDASEALALVAARPGSEALLVDADGRSWQSAGFAAAAGFEPLPASSGGSAAPIPSP